MKEFFYRLSWDDEYKHSLFKRTMIILGSTIGALCLVFGCVMVAVSQPYVDNGGYFDKAEEEDKSGFDLIFSDNKWNNEEENKDNNDSSEDQQNSDHSTDNNSSETNNASDSTSAGTSDTGGGSSSGGGEAPAGHTHSWHKVVDSGAWTETKQVFAGYLYVCNNCGFSTSDSGAMSSHCSRMSHSFRSTPRYETQETYHPEVSHEECSCGARR